MEEHLQKALSDLAASTQKPTFNETLTLLGSPVAELDAIMAAPPSPGQRKESLEKKHLKLAGQCIVLIRHKENVTKAIDTLEQECANISKDLSDLERPDIRPEALVHFVNMLEEANQYFEYKKIAKQSHDFSQSSKPGEVFGTLLADRKLNSKFSRLGKEEIEIAAHAIFWEVYDDRFRKEGKRRNEDVALIDWIYKLAFETREKGYLMDQDPVAELEKIWKSERGVYYSYFVDNVLRATCTEGAIEEAHRKYSQLVRIMRDNYTEYEKDELTSTATSARSKDPFDEKLKLTSSGSNGRSSTSKRPPPCRRAA